jgi:hypothetical protein
MIEMQGAYLSQDAAIHKYPRKEKQRASPSLRVLRNTNTRGKTAEGIVLAGGATIHNTRGNTYSGRRTSWKCHGTLILAER